MWLVFMLASCGTSDEGSSSTQVRSDRPHIVLVTLDTVRADRIGAYGYTNATTPAIDGLAERGLRFERAYSPYPFTIPAHSSLMTGLYPPQHQVRDNGDKPLGAEFETLAEVLDEVGYATAASVAAFVTSRQWGLSQGFDTYLDNVPRAKDFWHASRRGSEVVDDALEWVDTVPHGTPMFLWVHLYDAHLPLQPVEPFASAHPHKPYDAEIAYVDAQVARLIDRFDVDNTLFVIAADHGESNGDHGERGHGLYVYDATQRIPWIIAGPGVTSTVSDQVVSLVDVMPTVLDLAGIDIPEGLAGRPVPSDEDRPVYVESWQLANRFGFAPHVGVLVGDHKFIDLPQPELYALNSDPSERRNLADDEPDRVARMSQTLDQLGFAPPPRGQDALSTEVVLELEALGYLTSERPDSPPEALPDPKRHQDLLMEVQKADLRIEADLDQAAGTLSELLSRYPGIGELRARLASVLLKKGDFDEAETLVREGLQRSSTPRLRSLMADVLLAQGRISEAADLLVLERTHQEYSPRYRTRVLHALLAADRGAEAEALAESFLLAYPGDLEVLGTLGVYLAGTPRASEAWPMLERALEADPPPRDVCFTLGIRASVDGDEQGGIALLEREVANHPFSWNARSVLASRARDRADWAGWRDHTGHMIRVKHDDVGAWRDHAQALFNLGEYEAAREAVDHALSLASDNPHIVLLDANLMAIEGNTEEGESRFKEAKRLFETKP